ncbi:hypothetical protein Bca101_074990 [Brassica carinata]
MDEIPRWPVNRNMAIDVNLKVATLLRADGMLTHTYGALSRFQANQNQKSLDSEDPQREGVKTSDTTTRAPDLAKSRMGHLGDSGSYLFQRVSTGTGLTEGTRTQICITPTLVGVESNLARTQPLRNFIKHVGSV